MMRDPRRERALNAANGLDWWDRNEGRLVALACVLIAFCVSALGWLGRDSLLAWWRALAG